MWVWVLIYKQRLYLIWGSFENTGTLVDGVGQQAVFLTLQLFCCPVQRFGDHASLRDITLERAEEKKHQAQPMTTRDSSC